VVFCVVALASKLHWVGSLDNALTVQSFAARGPVEPASSVAVVGVGGASWTSLGPWPWPAGLWAELLERIFASGARVVALDLPALDQAIALPLADAKGAKRLLQVVQHRRVVLPFVVAEGASTQSKPFELLSPHVCAPGDAPPRSLTDMHVDVPPPELAARAAGLGCLNVYPDQDGIVRAAPLLVNLGGQSYPSLALEAARLMSGLAPGAPRQSGGLVGLGDHQYRVLPSGEMLINYAGGYMSYPQLSAVDVLRGRADELRGQLQGRAVLIGSVARDTPNLLATPVAARMPAVEVQANILGNLLRDDYLRPLPAYLAWLLLLGACLVPGLLVSGRSAVAGTAITLILAILAWLTGHLLFCQGQYVPLGAPLTGLLLTGASLVTAEALSAERRKLKAETRLHSRLQAITGVGRLLDTSLDRQELLDEIMRWIQTELDVEACSMLLLDEARQRLRFAVALGPKGDLASEFEVEVGQGIAGIVAQTGEPLLLNQAATDPRRHREIPQAIGYPVEKIACVPMSLRGEVVGVIEAMNKCDGSDFTEYDSSLLTVIAQQAALFLDNLRLYGLLRERVEYANAELLAAMGRLRREKARIDTLVEEMADGVVATDGEDRVVLVNSRARLMLGLEGQALENEPVRAVMRHPRVAALLARALPRHDEVTAEEIDLHGDESQVVRMSVADIEGGAGESVGKCAVLTDITQFKQLDQMKTDLVSFVSHQLKTPLTSLGMYGQLLRSRLRDEHPKEALEAAEAMERQVARMRHMVEDFLNVSRLEAGTPLEMTWRPVAGVRELVLEIVNLEGRLARDHQFTVDVPADLPALWGDRGKLEEVLINLVSNAIKYSPDGGPVTVSARPEGDMIGFSVRDQGLGIAPEAQERLFRRFERVGAAQRHAGIAGTGIGLFVCKALVEAHGGTISVESQVDEGSVFHFTIPAYRGQDQEPTADAG
jgi:PAS domain S-box-containing protein